MLAKQKIMHRYLGDNCGKIYSKYWDMIFAINKNEVYNSSYVGYSTQLQTIPDLYLSPSAEAEVYPQRISGTP
jgi:hypothetical protein